MRIKSHDDKRDLAPPGFLLAGPQHEAVPGMDAQLKLQDQIAQVLSKQRHEQGALDFESHAGRVEPRRAVTTTGTNGPRDNPRRTSRLMAPWLS